jgi:hypothetical protein
MILNISGELGELDELDIYFISNNYLALMFIYCNL